MKEYQLNHVEEIQLNILQTEFDKRVLRDKKYSMRKFATDANIDPSTLSQYFRKKRKLTPETFMQILQRLRVDQEILEKYQKNIKELDLLSEKHQEVKKHWFYYTILESFGLNDFNPDLSWFSKRLGMEEKDVENALKLLEEIGAMKVKDENYIDTLGSVTFVNDINMDIEAGRQYQKELLHKAKESIEQNEGSIKDHTSLCFAFNTALMPEVKKKIQTFRQEMAHFIDNNSTKNCNEVYSIQINMFPLTKKEQ